MNQNFFYFILFFTTIVFCLDHSILDGFDDDNDDSESSVGKHGVVGHWRQEGQNGLNQHDKAIVAQLFDTVWNKNDLLPEYDGSLDHIRCPKTRGRPYTIWCDDKGFVTRLSLTGVDADGAPLLPTQLYTLEKLQMIELVAFRNALPSELHSEKILNWKNITTLTIAHTDALIGTLPSSISKLTSLIELHIAEVPKLQGTMY